MVVLRGGGLEVVPKSRKRAFRAAYILCATIYPHYIVASQTRLTIVGKILHNSKSYEKNLREYPGCKLFFALLDFLKAAEGRLGSASTAHERT